MYKCTEQKVVTRDARNASMVYFLFAVVLRFSEIKKQVWWEPSPLTLGTSLSSHPSIIIMY